MAAAMTDVFNVTRSAITKPTITITAIAEPNITVAAVAESTIALNAITTAIARISECRGCATSEQKATCNDRGSQKAFHKSISSVVFSGPGNDPQTNQHEGDLATRRMNRL